MSDIKKPSQTGANEHGFDAGFDAFLREEDSRLAALYRKLPRPEPDTALDMRVRAQARRALNESAKTTAPAGTPRARRWLPAFSAAATLVLAAGMAWKLMPPASPTREVAIIADTAAPAAMQTERSAPVPTPVAPSPAQPAAPQAPMDATAQFEHELHRAIPAKPESASSAGKAGTEAGSAANGALAATAKIAAPAAAALPGKSEPAAFPLHPVEQRAKSAPPPAAAAAPPPPPAAMEAETARPASDAAAAPSPALRETASADRAAAAEAFVDRAAAGGSSFVIRPDPSGPSRYRWEAAGGTRSGIYPPDPPPFAAWVEIVRAMLRDGHRDAARSALADLRAHHPDFRVPPDLRGLE